jgi:glyoxylase-like metal-dependent hydrolase (beta-lactamase superfamily II)
MTAEPDLDWFEVREFAHGVIGIREPGHFEDVKSFLVAGDDLALLIDTGMGFADIRAVVERYTDKPVLLVNSHGHLDHIGDNWRFERRWAHPGDLERIREGVPNERLQHFLAPEAFSQNPPAGLDAKTFEIPGTDVERTVEDGDEIDLGGRVFRILHTPGHSAGSISIFEEETGILFVGDVIYEGPLFAQHPGGSTSDYRKTLDRLTAMIPDVSVVYPSHNRYPLEPSFIRDVADSFDEIWNGRQPDASGDGLERFEFGSFSFTLRQSWREEELTRD